MIESIEQGRKEDGSRSIADKIKRRLHDLDKTVESNFGRWVWELLQNAKDSIADDTDRAVSVKIEINEDSSVVFKHNGSYFTELDIRGLINQISSKEVEPDEQTRKTGRFGTGFLTTHLLSRKVQISGVVKTSDNDFYTFDFLLDRDGETTAELAPKVEMAWKEFQESTKKINSNYDVNDFNTSFCYLLETKEQKEIAKRGIKEFVTLVPYVLAFIPKIKDVKILSNKTKSFIHFENTNEIIDHSIVKIKKNNNSIISDILILRSMNDKVSIATEVEKIENGYAIKSIENIPKLFCDFPLIGSENFHFPVVVNSFFFNPQTERDGIWLKGSSDDKEVLQNKELLENSIELFKNLVNEIAEEDFFDLYNLATTKTPATDDKYFDKTWYIENIQKPLREFLNQSKLVETNKGKESIEKVYFPNKDENKENRQKLWQFSSDLKVNALPIEEHIQKWANVIWDDCKKVDIDDIVNDLKDKKNILGLVNTLECDSTQVFEWLNEYLKFVYENSSSFTFNSYEIIPNQEGEFRPCKNLYLDEIDDEVVKEIAKLIEYNYYEELVHRDIFLTSEQCTKAITLDEVSRKISSLLDNETDSANRKAAITMLIEWFDNNEERSKEYFPTLYRKKEKLLVDTIEDKKSLYSILNSKVEISQIASLVKQAKNSPETIMESIDKAKVLDDLLKEYGASNIVELKELILSSTATRSEQTEPKREITQEILASLGVTTFEELKEALKDEKVAQQFYHTSTPTVEMFKYAQEKIERAKRNIIEYLKNHPDYDCSDYEELAPTVIGGIKKHDRSQLIVVRPSDNQQVIIYYDSEKDSLDYESAELWIEDGNNIPIHLTLGKVLKSTRITRIPV